MKIIALAACYNRKQLTLNALQTLKEQLLPNKVILEICLVDDNSSDGTYEHVLELYPDVNIIKGNGSLFWCGGMRYGWDNWVSKQDYDAILVFNDDIILYPDAIKRLICSAQLVAEHTPSFVVVGSLKDSKTGKISYGGVVKKYKFHPTRFVLVEPSSVNVECDTLNMNLALISPGAIDSIGFLSKNYVHHRADYDYGLRLKASGGQVIVAGGYYGVCDRDSSARDSAVYDMPFLKGWKKLNSIKHASPSERAIFMRLHGGLFWPVFWVIPYVMFIFRWGKRQLLRRAFN